VDLSFTPEQEAFRLRLRAWLTENLPAEWGTERFLGFANDDEETTFLRAWQAKLHRAGWCGLSWPREYGGAGATPIEQAIFAEEMARAQAPELVNKVGINNVGPTLMRHGTEEQKRRFLPTILSGEEIWCQLFSEPGAGSDLAAIRTRAERDGDGWRISGQKVWTSFALVSRWAICLARTDPVAPRHHGITYFIVDMQAPGLDIRPLRQMTGGAEFNEVFLDAVPVAPQHVIGGVNEGWQVAMDTLAHERGTGYLFKEQVKTRITFDRLAELVRQRKAAGQPVPASLRHAVVRGWIGVEIMRLHNLDTITRLARGEEPGPESSLKKEFWTHYAQDLHETMIAAQGMAGQLASDDSRAIDRGRWQQGFLYSRSWSISGGTSEIQLNIIAQRMLGLPRR
jgi:alkylation response protein AidB-like acyl-CoA dehydrogenase